MIHILQVFAAEEPGGISALGLDPLALLAQGVTFLLLFWLLKHFALDKIVSTLEKRRETINNGIRFAQEMEAEKAKLEERVDELLAKARAEADRLVAEGKLDAAEIIRQAEADAAKRVEKILADGRAQIDQEVEKTKKELEKELVSLIAKATEAVLGEKLDTTKDMNLIVRELKGVRR